MKNLHGLVHGLDTWMLIAAGIYTQWKGYQAGGGWHSQGCEELSVNSKRLLSHVLYQQQHVLHQACAQYMTSMQHQASRRQ